MASRSRNVRLFQAEMDIAYLFKAQPRRVLSAVSPAKWDVLSIILAGSQDTRWQERGQTHRFQVGPGDVVFWPGRMSRLDANDPPVPPLTTLAISFRWLNPPPELPHKVCDRLGTIRVLAETILLLQASHRANKQVLLNSYLSAILAEYCRLAEHEGEGLAGRVTRYVYDHIRERISPQDLARHLGLSTRHLRREFKALTGQTPSQVVQQIRLDRAARMVWQTPRPLKDIAGMTGICDEHELSKLLKKHTGLTVRELRASHPDTARGHLKPGHLRHKKVSRP